MSLTKRNYFSKEIRAFKLFGVSLSGDESTLYKIYSLILLPPTVFLYPVLDFYEYFRHDASVIADIIVYQIATFLTLCKMTVVLRNRNKIGKLLDKLEQEPFVPNIQRGGQVEEKLVEECLKLTSAQTYIFWSFAAITISFTAIFAIIKRITSHDYNDWQMPYGPLTLFNVTYSPSYEINFFYQNISIIYISSLFITNDLILASVLAHISFQFKILQNFFKQIVENAYKKMIEDANNLDFKLLKYSACLNEIDGSKIPWKYLNQSMIEGIEYHVAIINIAKEVDEVFSYLLLIVFLGTLILLCFSTYAASLAGNQQSAAKHIGEGIVACFQVASVCFWGEQALQESQLVANAVYESNFIGTDLRFQKMLALVICRSQKPIKITAGKFADICLTTFAWILRTSYTSLMVLRKTSM